LIMFWWTDMGNINNITDEKAEILKTLPTPCFVVDEALVKRNLKI